MIEIDNLTLQDHLKIYTDEMLKFCYMAMDNAYNIGKARGYHEATDDVKAYADASFRNRMLERIDDEMENCDNCPGFDEGVYFGLMTARQIICEEMGAPEND